MKSFQNAMRSRRAFLRSVGQGAVALPFYRLLENSAAQAATGDGPLRFIGVYLPHGVAAPLFNRKTGETETAFSLTGTDAVLSPFDDAVTYGQSFKDKIISIEGMDLSAGIEKSTNGHDASCVILTGSAPQGQLLPGPSLDQYLAVDKGLGAKTRLSSLVLAVGNRATESGWNLSYASTGNPLPKIIDPSETFRVLFADFVVNGNPAAAAALERKRRRGQSVLDFLRKDIGRLQTRLATTEKLKLEQHLSALRDLEKRLLPTDIVCTPGAAPAKIDKLQMYNGGEPNFDRITDLQIDLLAQAMACDLTRFATLYLNDLSRTGLIPGYPEDVHNAVAHTFDAPVNNGGQVTTGRPETWQRLAVQNRYSVGKLARLMQKLAAADVLDNAVIYASGDMGDPARHSLRNPMTLLCGGLGGKVKTGRRIVLPTDCPAGQEYCNKPTLVSNNKLLVRISEWFGAPIESFGKATDPAIATGGLSEL